MPVNAISPSQHPTLENLPTSQQANNILTCLRLLVACSQCAEDVKSRSMLESTIHTYHTYTLPNAQLEDLCAVLLEEEKEQENIKTLLINAINSVAKQYCFDGFSLPPPSDTEEIRRQSSPSPLGTPFEYRSFNFLEKVPEIDLDKK